jgi:hypothetical protein
MERDQKPLCSGWVIQSDATLVEGDSQKLMATNGGGELEVIVKAVVRHCRWWFGLCGHPFFQSFQPESDKELRDDESLISAAQADIEDLPRPLPVVLASNPMGCNTNPA